MTKCRICGRKEGSTKDRCGEEDGVPLGPVERCPTCKRSACPDCLHEADCCFLGHEGGAAPRGWYLRTVKDGVTEYARMEP
jgi:hypothetical protein